MKKFMPIFIALIILSVSYQLIVIFFIHGYTTSYSVVGKDNLYDVKEVLYDNNKYDFYIKDKNDNIFVINDKFNFNKQKGVIKDIAYYSDKKMVCILPIYKRNNIGNITCLYDSSQVDYSYLVTNSINTASMLKKFKEYGYSLDKSINLKSSTKKYSLDNQDIYVYKDNIYDGYTFTIWDYNGIFFINKEKTVKKNYLDEDLYDNTNSRIVGKYYFMFQYSSDETIRDLYFVNLEDYGKGYIYIRNGLYSNIYINGVYDKKLYVTDLKAKKQYALNPYKENFEVIGENNDYKILRNNVLESINMKAYFGAKYYFDRVDVPNIYNKFGDVNVVQSDNYYYFVKDDIFYKQYKDYQIIEKLFKYENVTDWKVVDGDIIFTQGDTLFLFSERYGIKPIAKSKELKFNYKNICNLYKKS